MWPVVLLTTLCLGCGSGTAGPGPSGPTGLTAEEMTLSELALAIGVHAGVNDIRESQGLAPLGWHFTASQVAFQHSLDMRARGYLDHISPEGEGPGHRLAAAWIAGVFWSEVIGRDARDAHDVIEAWMASDSHRDAILDPDITHVGPGVSGTGPDAYWTLDFLRVD